MLFMVYNYIKQKEGVCVINFAGKKRAYIGVDVFLASNAEDLFQLFAKRHIQMVLCVKDKQEEEEMSKHELFDYMAYVVRDMDLGIWGMTVDIARDTKIKDSQCVSIMGNPHSWMPSVDQVDTIVEYGSPERFIRFKLLYDRLLFTLLTIIVLLCVFVITQIIRHGVLTMPNGPLMIMMSAICIGICFLFGVYRGVYTVGAFLLEMFDWWWLS